MTRARRTRSTRPRTFLYYELELANFAAILDDDQQSEEKDISRNSKSIFPRTTTRSICSRTPSKFKQSAHAKPSSWTATSSTYLTCVKNDDVACLMTSGGLYIMSLIFNSAVSNIKAATHLDPNNSDEHNIIRVRTDFRTWG